LKIRLVIREFWPLKGGLTLHALRLGQELLLRGHDFEVITPFTTQRPDGNNLFWAKETSRSFLNEGVPTHVVGLSLRERLFLLPLKKLQWRNDTRQIAKALLQKVLSPKFERLYKGADLVHYDGAGMEFMGFAAVKAARRCGIPFMIQPSVHFGQWGHLPVDHEFFRLADALLAHSLVEKCYLEKVVPNKPVHLVYNGIDDQPTGNAEKFREKFGIRKPFVLFLGRKTEDKGYFLLREAFATITKKHSHFSLVCAGPGGGLPSESNMMELEYITDEEKADALAACEFLCVPSEGESFGLVFLEAGRARKAYLARDLELFDDLLGLNGETGLRIGRRQDDGRVLISAEELAKGIEAMLHTPEKSKIDMGKAGFSNAERFLWDETIERFLVAYRSVIPSEL
jgi:glycosyltransferase involved in cell wall biosynthesis